MIDWLFCKSCDHAHSPLRNSLCFLGPIVSNGRTRNDELSPDYIEHLLDPPDSWNLDLYDFWRFGMLKQ
jgi:hypothetical protein